MRLPIGAPGHCGVIPDDVVGGVAAPPLYIVRPRCDSAVFHKVIEKEATNRYRGAVERDAQILLWIQLR